MAETLLLLNLVALGFASRKRMGLGNPFQIYFSIWSLVIAAYVGLKDLFYDVDGVFFFLLICSESVAIFLLSITYFTNESKDFQRVGKTHSYTSRVRVLYFALGVLALLSPLVYRHAMHLSGGMSVFSVEGYVRLRYSLNYENQSYGVFAYAFMCAFVVSSVAVDAYRKRLVSLSFLLLSLGISFFYAYMSTGRTFWLLLFSLIFVPLIVNGAIRVRGVFFASLLLVAVFLLVAIMTAKGVSLNDSFANNLTGIGENLLSYTVAPLVACNELFKSNINPELGLYSFRFFYAVAYKLGFIEIPPVDLIKDIVYVPYKTNVYTVYEIYFRDFSVVGFFIPPLFLILHQYLYSKSRTRKGVWIFLYAASVYPLIMQFFQDQYFSLFSQWIQIVIWYMLFIKSYKKRNYSHIR